MAKEKLISLKLFHYKKTTTIGNNVYDEWKPGIHEDIILFQYDQLISAGLEPVLSHSEKSCITLYYRQYSTYIKIKIIKLIPVL